VSRRGPRSEDVAPTVSQRDVLLIDGLRLNASNVGADSHGE
jgi:hypothetical protein